MNAWGTAYYVTLAAVMVGGVGVALAFLWMRRPLFRHRDLASVDANFLLAVITLLYVWSAVRLGVNAWQHNLRQPSIAQAVAGIGFGAAIDAAFIVRLIHWRRFRATAPPTHLCTECGQPHY